jgi:hypothetical protein
MLFMKESVIFASTEMNVRVKGLRNGVISPNVCSKSGTKYSNINSKSRYNPLCSIGCKLLIYESNRTLPTIEILECQEVYSIVIP